MTRAENMQLKELAEKNVLNGYKLGQSNDFIRGRWYRILEELDGTTEHDLILNWHHMIQIFDRDSDLDEIQSGYDFQSAVIDATGM